MVRHGLRVAGAVLACLLTCGGTPAQAAGDGVVKGSNLKAAAFGGGIFVNGVGRNWFEFSTTGKLKFSFVETHRDEWSVYLKCTSRDLKIAIDVFKNKIKVTTGKPARTFVLGAVTKKYKELTQTHRGYLAPHTSPADLRGDGLCYCDSQDYLEQVGAFQRAWQKPPAKTGPGIMVRNETFHTLDMALLGSSAIPVPGSSGVKYYGMAKPGRIFYRSTGHWMFDIEAALNVSGKERYDDTDVVLPVAMDVGITLATIYWGSPTTWGKNAMAGSALTAGTVSAAQGGTAVLWRAAEGFVMDAGARLLKDAAEKVFIKKNTYRVLEDVTAGGTDPLELYRVIGGPGIPCVRRADKQVLIEGSGPGATRPLKVVSPGLLPGDLATKYDPDKDMNAQMYTYKVYDKWSLGIDCNHGDLPLKLTRTGDKIKAVFWAGKKKLAEGHLGPFKPDCGSFSDDDQFWAWSLRQKGMEKKGLSKDGSPPKGGEPITRVDLITTGGDAFFIDELYLYRENFEWNRPKSGSTHYETETRGHWGTDDGKGYCLSTDAGDANYKGDDFYKYVDGCHRGLSFLIGEGLSKEQLRKIGAKVTVADVTKWIKAAGGKVYPLLPDPK
jgi:hypothetical protein